jgi:hypothetical protein
MSPSRRTTTPATERAAAPAGHTKDRTTPCASGIHEPSSGPHWRRCGIPPLSTSPRSFAGSTCAVSPAPGVACEAYTLPDETEVQCLARWRSAGSAPGTKPGCHDTSTTASQLCLGSAAYASGSGLSAAPMTGRRRSANCGRGPGRSRDVHVPRPGEPVHASAAPFRQAPAVTSGAVHQTPPAVTTRFAAGVATRVCSQPDPCPPRPLRSTAW